MKQYFVYILTNKYNKVFYIGVTNNLERRTIEHEAEQYSSFCKRYNVNKLVYYEDGAIALDAIAREK